MNFNEHWNQVGKHAFLSASKYSWINYDENKLVEAYNNYLAVERGTELHAFAAKCIELGQRLPNTRAHLTLNEYVNDAIGYGMSPERVLYFSDNAFGTTDSISFKNRCYSSTHGAARDLCCFLLFGIPEKSRRHYDSIKTLSK